MRILREMIKEEWRMHSRVFGSKSFALFPLVVLAVSAFLGLSAVFTGFSVPQVFLGVNTLLFFLGLNVGSIGFISRDGMKNLLGDTNLLIFSSRTLPISKKKIVSLFLVKDLIYYVLLFVTPITAGVLALNLSTPVGIREVVLLWVTGSGMFGLGVGTSFVGASLYNRGWTHLLSGSVLAVAVMVYMGSGLVRFTPLGFANSPSLTGFAAGFAPAAVLLALGVFLFKPESNREARVFDERFSSTLESLSFDRTGLVSKSFLDLSRSSGGLWKVGLSQGIIFAFFAYMMTQVPFLSNTSSPGMVFAVIMGIASLSTYNWINRFDSLGEYEKLPIDARDLFEAKLSLYLLVSLPIAWAFVTAGSVFFGLEGFVTGIIALPMVSVYLAGVTSWIAGLNPNTMLFDSKKFAVFLVGIALGVVPMLVVSLLYSFAPDVVTAVYLAGSLLLGVTGYWVFHRGVRRWS